MFKTENEQQQKNTVNRQLKRDKAAAEGCKPDKPLEEKLLPCYYSLRLNVHQK